MWLEFTVYVSGVHELQLHPVGHSVIGYVEVEHVTFDGALEQEHDAELLLYFHEPHVVQLADHALLYVHALHFLLEGVDVLSLDQ